KGGGANWMCQSVYIQRSRSDLGTPALTRNRPRLSGAQNSYARGVAQPDTAAVSHATPWASAHGLDPWGRPGAHHAAAPAFADRHDFAAAEPWVPACAGKARRELPPA